MKSFNHLIGHLVSCKDVSHLLSEMQERELSVLGPRSKGRKQLEAQTNRWDELVRAVNRILRPASE